jgi:hypothetical protein
MTPHPPCLHDARLSDAVGQGSTGRRANTGS